MNKSYRSLQALKETDTFPVSYNSDSVIQTPTSSTPVGILNRETEHLSLVEELFVCFAVLERARAEY